jgi:PAS domain-containing protein
LADCGNAAAWETVVGHQQSPYFPLMLPSQNRIFQRIPIAVVSAIKCLGDWTLHKSRELLDKGESTLAQKAAITAGSQESHLLAAGQEIQHILDALPFYALLVDSDHHIVTVNRAVCGISR